MATLVEAKFIQPMSTIPENKRIVRDFYDLAFNQRRPADAGGKHVGVTCRQHDPRFGDGATAFSAGIATWLATMPKLLVEVKRVLAEGDLVFVHSHFTPAPGARGMAVMDIFRLDHGKIVEHWDVVQDVPQELVHKNTMF